MKIIPFKQVNTKDSFFDTFRKNYPEWDDWCERKKDDMVYIDELDGKIISFMKLKIEYTQIIYPYKVEPEISEKILKICSFKSLQYFCDSFLKYIEDYAHSENIDVIYGTIFISTDTIKLYEFLNNNGFIPSGIKDNGEIIITKRL